MRKKWHLFFNTTLMIPLGVLLYYYILDSTILIPMIYLSIGIGAVFPDLDLAFGQRYHRHWLFHSIIWLIGCWFLSIIYPIFMLFIALLMVSIGIHLICDLHIRRRYMIGFYTVKLYYNVFSRKVKGLNGIQSTMWYFGNFVLSIILLVITCVWVI